MIDDAICITKKFLKKHQNYSLCPLYVLPNGGSHVSNQRTRRNMDINVHVILPVYHKDVLVSQLPPLCPPAEEQVYPLTLSEHRPPL